MVMASPFPGMNPYLENPLFWSEIHNLLIVAIFRKLNPQLRPKYKVAIEKRVYQIIDEDSLLVGIADVAVQSTQQKSSPELANIAVASPSIQAVTVDVTMPETVKETYLEVRDIATQEVVTIIEILSPKNKRRGEGRNAYTKKRLQVLGSYTNLVEIDLLRDGKPIQQLQNNLQTDYRILVSRATTRPKADLFAFNLPNPIPAFLLPLREDDTEPLLDIQTLISEIYDEGNYDLVIDYNQEAVPAMSAENIAWVNAVLKEKGLRN
jgi:Uma2 family endonuclease